MMRVVFWDKVMHTFHAFPNVVKFCLERQVIDGRSVLCWVLTFLDESKDVLLKSEFDFDSAEI